MGNVGQLACDLLISSLELCKVGYITSNCVLPVAGYNPFSDSQDQQSIALSTEGIPVFDIFCNILSLGEKSKETKVA